MGAAVIGICVLNEPYTAESLVGSALLFMAILILIVGPELKFRVKNRLAFSE